MMEVYKQRRQKLMEGKVFPAAVCIFSGSAPMRSLDEAYPFSVDRNFYYLTGIEKENMILVLQYTADGSIEETLYIEPFDEVLAKWVGPRMRADEVYEISGIRQTKDIAAFRDDLNTYIERNRGAGKHHVYLDLWRYRADQSDTPAHTLAAWLQQRYPAVAIEDIFPETAAMRSIKAPEEIDCMRQAQETTRIAIEAMMKYAYPGVNEAELEGAFDFALMKQGVRQHAFPTIVAGGANAATLHYTENCCTVEDGQMVLIDLGSTHGNYCADISRTFPVNGRFSPRQKELYDTVLEAQRIVMDHAKPGITTRELNQLVTDYYESRLEDLGLRKNGLGVSDYYYHGVSHSLGLDTHDASTGRNLLLEPGMVITVEPGLYVEAEGIGIRIENDILITENGCIDLSSDIPKTTEEIEAVMAK